PPTARATTVHSPFESDATDAFRPAFTDRSTYDFANDDLPVPTVPNNIIDIPEIIPRAYSSQGSKVNAPPPFWSVPIYTPSAPNEGPATYGNDVADAVAEVGIFCTRIRLVPRTDCCLFGPPAPYCIRGNTSCICAASAASAPWCSFTSAFHCFLRFLRSLRVLGITPK